MKKMLLVFGFLLFTAAFLVTFPCGSQLFAQSGCCKERDSYRVQWYPNRKNFKDCEDLNRDKDGDNVFDEGGLVWWDSKCQ